MPKKRQPGRQILGFITHNNDDCFSLAFTDDLLALLIDPFLIFNTELITVEQENNDLNQIIKGRGAWVCLSTRGT